MSDLPPVIPTFHGPLTAERLRQVVSYNQRTGVFTRLISTAPRVRVGDIAGSLVTRGYLAFAVDGKLYRAHRLAWLYMTGEWPPARLDHRNTDPADNRWKNLRPATATQNCANSRRPRNNRSGFKGVSWVERLGRWKAGVKCDGQFYYLGLFDSPEAAHKAYRAKAKELFGEFARAA